MQTVYLKDNILIISEDCSSHVREYFLEQDGSKEERMRKKSNQNMYPGFKKVGSFDLDMATLSYKEILEICGI